MCPELPGPGRMTTEYLGTIQCAFAPTAGLPE